MNELLKLTLSGAIGGAIGGLAAASNKQHISVNEFHELRSHSYIIFKDTTYTYAQNGLNGNIDFRSLDSTDVILFAIEITEFNGGGTIFIKSGIYNLTRSLHTGSNISLIGENFGSTIFKMSDFANTKMIDDINIQSNISIKNITFDANGLNQMDGIDRSTLVPIRLKQKTNLIIENIMITNGRTGAGLNFGGVNNAKVINCYFINNGTVPGSAFLSDHFYSQNCNDLLVQGCTFIGCTDVGSAQDFNKNSRIIGCYFKDCLQAAFTWYHVEGPTTPPENMIVDSCIIDATDQNTGFYIAKKALQPLKPSKVIVSNCIIKGGKIGAKVNNCDYIKINNCYIHSQTENSILLNNSTQCEISGCTIENAPIGISTPVVSDATIQNNKFINITTKISNTNNVNMIIRDNWGKSPYNWGNLSSPPTPFGEGDEYYDTTLKLKKYYNGNVWL